MCSPERPAPDLAPRWDGAPRRYDRRCPQEDMQNETMLQDGCGLKIHRIGDAFQNGRNGASQESRDLAGLRPVRRDRIRCSHSIFSRFRRNRPAITTMNPTADAGGIDRLTWNCSTRVGRGSVGMTLVAWVGGSHGPIRVKDRVCTASAFPATSVAKYSS